MAKIPSISFGRQVSVDVPRGPDRSTQIARAKGEAFSDFAKGATAFGQGVNQIYQERKKAEDNAFISTMKSDLQVNRLKWEQAEKTRIEKEGLDPSGYAERSQEFLKEQRETYGERATNPEQKQFLDFYLKNEQNIAQIRDNQYEANAKVNYYTRQKDQSRKDRINAIANAGNFDEAVKAYRDQAVDTMSSNILSADGKVKEMQKDKGILTSGLDTLLRNGKGGLIQGMDFLEGKRPELQSELAALGEDRNKYLAKFQRAAEIEKNKSINEAITQTKNLSSLAELEFSKNGIISANTKEQINNSIDGLSRLEQTDKVKKAKIVAESTLKNIDFMDEIKYLTVDEINKIDTTKDIKANDPETASVEMAVLNQRNKIINQYKKELYKDPAGVILREDKTLKQGSQELLEKQRARGISNPQVFSEQTQDQLKASLLNSTSKSQALGDILSSYELGKEGLAQMASKDKSMAIFSVASNFENQFTRTKMLDLNKKEINDRYKNEISTDDFEVESAVNDAMKPYFDSLGRNDAIINSLRDSAILMTKDQALTDRKRSVKDIANDLVNRTYGKELTPVQVGNSSILLQGRDQRYADELENFISSYDGIITADNFIKDINFDLEAMNIPKSAGYGRKLEFVRQEMERGEFKWVTSPTGDGVIQTFVDFDGVQKPFFYFNEVGTKTPVEIKYNEMSNIGNKF